MKIFKKLKKIFSFINDKCNHIYIDKFIINDIGYVHLICKNCGNNLVVTFSDYRKLLKENKIDEKDETYVANLFPFLSWGNNKEK